MRKFLIFLTKFRVFSLLIIGFLFFSFPHANLEAQSSGTGAPGLRIDVTGSNDEGDFGVAIQLGFVFDIFCHGTCLE